MTMGGNDGPKAPNNFSEGSGEYRRHRPTYPAQLAQSLAEVCTKRGLAVDVGCGNGQLSTLLAAVFDAVYATDISAEQIACAPDHPKVTFRCEPAERVGLADHSADLIVAAQAAHWFDLPAFFKEVRRIGKPGAVVALVTYGVPVVAGPAQTLFEDFYWHRIHAHWPVERVHVETGYRDFDFPFSEFSLPSCAIERRWDVADLWGYVQTWSATKIARRQGADTVLSQFERELNAAWGDPRQTYHVSWPIHGRVGRV